ncbi:MAG: aminotransferase class I/II-fold pyridoxal phosphate-dependent enzyme [Deltaproteobacteria bacterium]|nr:aminotransferase class I/II-fold pyridoxal phosphate-dependent enzyme [Deltaproteobacteria bacterium]
MDIKPTRRIESLPTYAFAVVDSMVQELRDRGIAPIDFGVGDPSIPTPRSIREACKVAIDERATSGYPSYIGDLGFREAVAAWSKMRFGLEIDPATEISSTIGSKEGIFNFHEAIVDPGDLVLIPSPGYPPYSRGTWFAEGRAWFYPLLEETGFLPDLDAIPSEVASEAKLIWVNYPNSPSGVCPGLDFFERLYAWTQNNEIILASDEAYSEYYFGEQPPPTSLQAGRDGVVVFNSLSKRSAMTGWRVGWVCGDRRIVEVFRKTKTNLDSGTPTFIQDAAVTALADEAHVREMREGYRVKRDVLVAALTAAGLPRCEPEGTIYIWQRVPEGMTSLEFTALLMKPETAVVCMPGSLIAEEVEGGLNPGEGYVRFALTPELDDVELAAERIAELSF